MLAAVQGLGGGAGLGFDSPLGFDMDGFRVREALGKWHMATIMIRY